MKTLARLLLVMAVLSAALAPLSVKAGGLGQDVSPQTRALELFGRLTPEERIGQLFLITFRGTQVDETTQIYDLIYTHHIGGVMLLAANDNFSPVGRTVSDAYALTRSLQSIESASAQSFAADPVTGRSYRPGYVPLLIGAAQEGDGYPYDQLLNDVTSLPSAMAIGATWKPALAEQVGEVMGAELQALGINLILGPSLDVLEMHQQTESYEDLGTRTFGGDPYWVGEMGRSYIAGLHAGSGNRLAVIAKHFPGRGSSDRPPDAEVATVRKSLEQLKQIELAPFFAVTGSLSNPPPPESVTDGLLVSHIRYQGFQGNIRETTRPVSFDAAAQEQLMALPELTSWRQQGGLVVSDDLGSRAVRRFYDSTERIFDAPQVALDAFLAGNDLLYANNFVANGDPDAYATILRTLSYFAQKYREDSAFAQRVDAAVLRILTLKFKLYPSFSLETVLPPEEGLASVGKNQQVNFEVARQAVTLISPSASELDALLPRAPDVREPIVFFTDTLAFQQCPRCQEQTALAVNALQNAVIKLYGPSVGGRVQPERLSSFSFADLQTLLAGGEAAADLESNLRASAWVVFSTLNSSPDRPSSQALRELLSQRPDLLRNKKVVVFAFNAPYYLDATDISRLTAYYGIYSKVPEFVEVAARVLFQELTPAGALPVSVPGVGYDLIAATAPDPGQVIPLYLDLPQPPSDGTVTPEPTSVPTFKVGDTIPLKTGLITDHNHKQVPDGTVVNFVFTIGGADGSVRTVETQTLRGEARATYRIEKPGLLEIRVMAEPAISSAILQLDVTDAGSAAITAIAPTPIPPTPTVTPQPTATITPTLAPTPTPMPPPEPGMGDWLMAVLAVGSGAGLAYMAGSAWMKTQRWGVRWALSALLGGLLAYLYLAGGLPGSQSWLGDSTSSAVLGAVLIGVGIGWAAGVIWWLVETQGGKARVKTGAGQKPKTDRPQS